MKKGSWKKKHDQIDEHDMPTEPLPALPAGFFIEPEQGNYIPGDRTVSAPFPPYGDPQSPLAGYPYAQPPSYHLQGYPSYPVLPGTPLGAPYGVWPADAGEKLRNTRNQRTRRRRFLPACVALFYFCLQVLLIVRFGIRLLSLSPDITWAGVVTDVSEIFVQPFRELWFQFPTVSAFFPANVEFYTLIAILIYGLLAGILKLMLKGR